MNVYRLLKYVSRIRSPRLRLLGLWGAHVFGRRYIGVFIDPILGCNYRCRMCYFSNTEVRRQKRGRMQEKQLQDVAHSLFSRTLKLQIGCGAEPTLDLAGTLELIRLGRQYKVPYISLTTNGVLLTRETLTEMATAGLNELTVSLHGIRRDTYEQMMGSTADYEAFLRLLQTIRMVKKEFPDLNIRINYTMNADNVDELADFDTLFADVPVNQLQLRPVRKIGDSDYNNFDLQHVADCLETVIRPLAARCAKRGITVLAPEEKHIRRFEAKTRSTARERLLSLFTYYNVDAQSYETAAIRYGQESYDDYARRCHIGRRLWQGVWADEKACEQIGQGLSNALNYDIR